MSEANDHDERHHQRGASDIAEIAEPVPLPPSEEDKRILQSLLDYVKMSQDPELAAKYGLRPGIGLAARKSTSRSG
ncbi:hypothetical protein [Geobacillus vulcani]|uniref:hypothetical protein n=1 Tax=Geobacillus vulcani TaxID=135517 RepID=UPI000A071C8E|nr:hypothetical protein [Geobacillus vulcani]